MRTRIFLLFCLFTGTTSYAQTQAEKDSIAVAIDSLELLKDDKTLSEVVVTAQKSLVKVDLDKITYDMAEDPEAKTNNVLEMLKKVPMVTVDGDENIQVKGSSDFKIYMNGKPSNLLSNNPKDVLKSMPANTIKSIEVITDPGAKYDAEGVTGILNIVTQSNSSMGGYTVSLSGNVDNLGSLGGGTYFSVKKGKLGLTGNLNASQFKSPKSDYSSFREDLKNHTLLTQKGWSKYNGTYMYGYGELSFEIDTLRLLSVSYNHWGGNATGESQRDVRLEDASQNILNEYSQFSKSKNAYGGPSLRADYQRSFAGVKDRLLTFSYNFNTSPDNSSSDIFTDDKPNNKQWSDGATDEHTLQLDYTTPVNNIHTIEAGVKYIKRINKSDSEFLVWNEVTGDWEPRLSDNDKFRHNSDILGAYAGYNVKLKKWGFKAGLRFEGTWLDAKFERNEAMNFDANYTNLVPSTTITYQLKQGQTFRVGYNLRIQRPGIWYLNPYRNTSDTTNVRFGNPNLDAVKYHNFTLNYSFFNPKFNANVNLSYNFADNTIEQHAWIENNTTYTTYENQGKSQGVGLSTYLNWSPIQKFRIYGNLSGRYTNIKSKQYDLQNDGFSANAYSGVQYTLPKDFTLYGNGYYGSPYIQLQGKGNAYYGYNVALSKAMLKKNLVVRLYANNPFLDKRKSTSSTFGPDFYSENFNSVKAQFFGMSVSYRFGEMKAQIKKVTRGISNDDNMGGGNSGGGGNSSQGGGGQ
ncbi:MAG: outer membrane beta-barrel family protein [Candidatus Symbiothrix sp.]|jgi:outer membrane receptor protein involved in Fe transport|nr:outer membrane beta-barrel family protein [Candidatus Symbiothrix sp.]